MGGKDKEAKADFSKKHDDSAHLTGKQKNLPDFIQKKIVAKKAKEPAKKESVKKEMMDKEAAFVAAGKGLVQGFKGLGSLTKNPKEALQALQQSVKSQGVKGTIKGNKKELAALGVSGVGLAGLGKALRGES